MDGGGGGQQGNAGGRRRGGGRGPPKDKVPGQAGGETGKAGEESTEDMPCRIRIANPKIPKHVLAFRACFATTRGRLRRFGGC